METGEGLVIIPKIEQKFYQVWYNRSVYTQVNSKIRYKPSD